MFCTIKSRNDMKAVETMGIKVLIVSKSIYLINCLNFPTKIFKFATKFS